jgi:hypothetical protein
MMMDMNMNKMGKQMMDFYKTTFDNSFSAMLMVQEQMEHMTNMFLGQTAAFPEEGKKALQEWIKAYKKGREEFKKSVDENFKRMAEASKPLEPAKPVTKQSESKTPAAKPSKSKTPAAKPSGPKAPATKPSEPAVPSLKPSVTATPVIKPSEPAPPAAEVSVVQTPARSIILPPRRP